MTEFFPRVRQAVQCLILLIPSNEACTAQPGVVTCKLPWSPGTNAGGAETRSTVHALKDCSGPPHWDTKHHEMPKKCQEQQENRRHEVASRLHSSPSTLLFLPLAWAASHRRASLVLQDLWQSPALPGWPGPYFLKYILQYSKTNVSD